MSWTAMNGKILQWVWDLFEIVNNRVTLIVDTAEKPEDINVRRAQEQKERAEERLRQQQSIQQYYHTQASLARAMNRLRVSQDKKWNL